MICKLCSSCSIAANQATTFVMTKTLNNDALNNDDAIIDFGYNNNSVLFTFKQKITGEADVGGTKNVEIMVPLKYLRNFWRTLEIPLINCEINVIPTLLAICVHHVVLLQIKQQHL